MIGADPQSYLRNTVLQATPEQLQLLLYDGALRFASQGREALERKDYEASYEKLSRSQAIVLEMEAGLRPEVNRKLCEQMSSLHNFVYRKLVQATVQRDVSPLDDAVKILRQMRETWVLLLEKVNVTRAELAASPSRPADGAYAGTLCVEG